MENACTAGEEKRRIATNNGTNSQVEEFSTQKLDNFAETSVLNNGNEMGESVSSSNSKNRCGEDTKSSCKSGGRRSRSRPRSEERRSHRRKHRSTSGDRERGRSRSSHKEKSSRRHRRKSSSRSSRSHSRSRSRSRSSNRKSRHSRKRRHHSSSGASDDGYSDHHRDKEKHWGHKTDCLQPNSTVMVRGLASHLKENDIQQDVIKCGFMIKEIRLIRDRESGRSRGFAFVEFKSVADATQWMDMKKGLLVLHDKFEANLNYSIPKMQSSGGFSKSMSDWNCENCNSHNFKRRDVCYQCYAARPQDQGEDLSDEISSYPTSTIILSNLDILSTEESVLQAFQSIPHLACMPIKTVKIARVTGTCMSKGYCYLEANNIAESIRLMDALSLSTLEIDGKIASACYGKIANTAVILKNSNAAAAAVAAAQWTNTTTLPPSTATRPPCTEVKTEADVEKMAQYSARLYAKTFDEFVSHLAYYREYYKQEVSKSTAAHSSSLHVDHRQHPSSLSILHNSVVAASGSQASFVWPGNQSIGLHQAGAPTLDASSYHYDAASQFFYDAGKQQFLQWKPHEQTYAAVSGEDTDKSKGGMNEQKGMKVEKLDTVKTARRISKEMKKWAKTLNEKKDRSSMPLQASSPNTSTLMETGERKRMASKFNNREPEYIYTIEEDVTTYLPASLVTNSLSRTCSEYDTADNDNESKLDLIPTCKDSSIVDENNLACLLCKRKFLNAEILQKHVAMSELHKKNLEALQQGQESDMSGTLSAASIKYRDRANERRKMFGSEKSVIHNAEKDLYLQTKKEQFSSHDEEPSNGRIKGDNIGNRILQKMGWHTGQGLGRNNQGRVDIIPVERRPEKLGLGICAPAVFDETLDLQTKAHKITLARYYELE